MPTPTYVSAADYQKGVAAVETGINIQGFEQSWSNERVNIENKAGSPTGFVHNFLISSSCTITGEVNTAALTGVLGVAQGVAETIANGIDGYGVTAGGWYMNEISISQDRGSLATASVSFEKFPDIA